MANTLRTRISTSFREPQGEAVIVDTRESGAVFDRATAEELVLLGINNRSTQTRVDVILTDDTILTWRLGEGFLQ